MVNDTDDPSSNHEKVHKPQLNLSLISDDDGNCSFCSSAPVCQSHLVRSIEEENTKKEKPSVIKQFRGMEQVLERNLNEPIPPCMVPLDDDERYQNKKKTAETNISNSERANDIENDRNSSNCKKIIQVSQRDETICQNNDDSSNTTILQSPISDSIDHHHNSIMDAQAQRASTLQYQQGQEILIPEAVLVVDDSKHRQDEYGNFDVHGIPCAEIVQPEKWSITIAGRNLNARLILASIILLIVAFTLTLSLTLTKSKTINTIAIPNLSPSFSPSFSSQPTSPLYSTLYRIIYADFNSEFDGEFNIHRRRAMDWLEQDQAAATATATNNTSGRQSSSLSSLPLLSNPTLLRERYALALLYFSTTSYSRWYDSLQFLSTNHVCTWRVKRYNEKKGVLRCGEDLRVLELSIYANNLRGTLPLELDFLSSLTVLRLHSNRLTNTLPFTLLGPSSSTAMSALSQVDLHSNDLSGTIPPSWAKLTNLTILHLSDNDIHGTLPTEMVRNWTKLKEFRIDGNLIEGEIPTSFGDIDILDIFHIDRNDLQGSMNFLCNNLPRDYKLDCTVTPLYPNPEVVCSCCIGCSIISDDSCAPSEVMANISILAGEREGSLVCELVQEVTEGDLDGSNDPNALRDNLLSIEGNYDYFPIYFWSFPEWWNLIAAGGDYMAMEVVNFQICLTYPGRYIFYTLSLSHNSSSDSTGEENDSDAVIYASIFGSPTMTVGPYGMQSFVLTENGTLQVMKAEELDDDAMAASFETDPEIGYGIPNYDNCLNFDLSLITDSFGDESTWEITQTNVSSSNGATNIGSVLVAFGGPYDSNSTNTHHECLARNKCYTFTLKDSFSDGICCESGEGSYQVAVNNRILSQDDRGGDFGASSTVQIGGDCSPNPLGDSSRWTCSNENASLLTVTIQTDEFGYETSWEVYNVYTGDVYTLNTGGEDGYGVMESNALHSANRCLEAKSNCTAFAIYDAAGDGFNQTSGGFFKVYNDGVLVASGSKNFGFKNVSYFGPSCP